MQNLNTTSFTSQYEPSVYQDAFSTVALNIGDDILDSVDAVLQQPTLDLASDVDEEFVVLPTSAENASPVTMQLLDNSQRERLFELFQELTGASPEVLNCESHESSESANIALALHDAMADDEFELAGVELLEETTQVKRYEFAFEDMSLYQKFILSVSPYVCFFRMPK